MEILIVVAIMAVITKRGVEDIIHTAKGGTPPRYAAASARRKSGAAGRYWGQLWDDTWEDMSRRRSERRDRRRTEPAARVDRPRGAATQFFAGLTEDARRAAGRRWEAGWVRLDEKRRERAARPRPGQETVPGEVVPNAKGGGKDRLRDKVYRKFEWSCNVCGSTRGVKDIWIGGVLSLGERYCPIHYAERFAEDGTRRKDGPPPVIPGFEDGSRPASRPQDDARPVPQVVPAQDGRTDLRFGEDETDPTGVSSCPECGGTGINRDGGICESCRDRQEQRNQHHEDQMTDCRNCKIGSASWSHTYDDYCAYPGPDSGPDNQTTTPPASTTTQEGTTTMTATIPTAEVGGLEQGVKFFETSADAYNQMVTAIEAAIAALDGFEVSGPARQAASIGMEASHTASLAMTTIAAELKKHRVVAEAIDATPGAGKREFYTAGR